MIKSMKPFTMLLLILILSGTMTNCTSRVSGGGTTITIAVVENDFGTNGNPKPQSIYAGAKLAADQMNARGYDVRLVPYADQDDPGTARQIAAQIADSAALAVIGHSTIETSAAAADVYDAKHIPAVGVIAANADLAESHDYYFNLSYTAEMQAAYHRQKAARLAHVHHSIDRFSHALFVLAIVSVSAYLLLIAAGALALVPEEIGHVVAKPLTFLGLALPALGAAFAGIRYLGDFDRFAAISEIAAEKLEALGSRIEVLLSGAEPELQYAQVASLAHALDEIVIAEIESWQSVFAVKNMAVPV